MNKCANNSRTKFKPKHKPKSPKRKTKSKLPSLKRTNNSFEKYGILLPSFEDIMEQKKKLESDKKILQDILPKIGIALPKFPSFVKIKEPKIKMLDCKHLTEEEIVNAFEKNLKYLSDICSEKIYCERHERFKSEQSVNDLSINSLTYNTSMIVFDWRQKKILVEMIDNHFQSGCVDYYFKVLMPELCLRIFMDTHRMSRSRAVEYLDKRPVED